MTRILSLNEVVAKVLELKPLQVTDQLAPSNTKNWDSFNGLVLFAEIEKNFDVEIALADLTKIKNVGDLRKILRKYVKVGLL